MKLSVYAVPSHAQEKELKDQVVVVIDVLRATSTILTALHNGCKEVIPAIEIEEVITMSRHYDKDSYLLCGERNALRIDGFHMSNSPLEYTREQVAGKTLLMTTTNGTRAVKKAIDAKAVVICGFVNIDAVTEYLVEMNSDVVFICAGTEGRFSLDDIAAAGAVINNIRKACDTVEMDDLAQVCSTVYECNATDLKGYLKDAAHYKKLMSLGLEDDIDYCLTLNAAPVVGIYQDGVIKTLDKLLKKQ